MPRADIKTTWPGRHPDREEVLGRSSSVLVGGGTDNIGIHNGSPSLAPLGLVLLPQSGAGLQGCYYKSLFANIK